jgi:dTDP-4-dehydrorhamnose 3,5-epimerase-like enzyme
MELAFSPILTSLETAPSQKAASYPWTDVTKNCQKGTSYWQPTRFGDTRGYCSEFRCFREHGVDAIFVQENHTQSAQKGMLRGLHFQVRPKRSASSRDKALDQSEGSNRRA